MLFFFIAPVLTSVGWSSTPVCLGIRGFGGCKVFHTKTKKVLGKPWWLVTLLVELSLFFFLNFILFLNFT